MQISERQPFDEVVSLGKQTIIFSPEMIIIRTNRAASGSASADLIAFAA